MKWSEGLIEETIRVFKPTAERLGRDFNREDAIESMDNMIALIEVLGKNEYKQNLPKPQKPLQV